MRSQNNISTYFLIVILTTIVSCGQKQNKEQNQNKIDYVSSTVVSKDSVIKNGNKTTILSTDIEKIRQLLASKQKLITKLNNLNLLWKKLEECHKYAQ